MEILQLFTTVVIVNIFLFNGYLFFIFWMYVQLQEIFTMEFILVHFVIFRNRTKKDKLLYYNFNFKI